MFYDLVSNTWTDDEMKNVLKVLRSHIFTMGEHVESFEAQFAQRVGCKHAVMVNSGSSANLIGVASLFFKKDRPLRRGDEVIVPSVGWATTYAPLQQYGLKLRFVDIDLQTLNLDINILEQAITPKSRLIVATNLLGNPATPDAIKMLAKRNNLYFFEENGESMGSELRGKRCGSFGDFSTFSFQFGNQISTMEGGMLVTDDKELYHIARSLRDYGAARSIPVGSTLISAKAEEFTDSTRILFPGYNLRPLEICGAAGIEQLKKLDAALEVRRQNAALVQDLFRNDDRFLFQKESGKSSWWAFSVILNPKYGFEREKVIKALREADIACGMISGGSLLKTEAIKHFDYECLGKMSNAEIVHDKGFCVGNHPQDLTRQLERFHQVLNTAVGAGRGGNVTYRSPFPKAA